MQGSPMDMGVPGIDTQSLHLPQPMAATPLSGLGPQWYSQRHWPPNYWTRGTQPLSPRH